MKIDWQKLCNNLRRYKSLSTVAREVGTAERCLNGMARGDIKAPRFDTGMKLLDLHLDKFPEKHQDLIL